MDHPRYDPPVPSCRLALIKLNGQTGRGSDVSARSDASDWGSSVHSASFISACLLIDCKLNCKEKPFNTFYWPCFFINCTFFFDCAAQQTSAQQPKRWVHFFFRKKCNDKHKQLGIRTRSGTGRTSHYIYSFPTLQTTRYTFSLVSASASTNARSLNACWCRRVCVNEARRWCLFRDP